MSLSQRASLGFASRFAMSAKRKRSPSPSPDLTQVFRSETIEDRSSTFIGLFSPSLKPKELQNLPEIACASHRVLAWRRESNQQAITGAPKFVCSSDDDGEKYGGKKIERVMDRMGVSGACVVARWYGGVMLGPVRFEHIERCARGAVENCRQSLEAERQRKMKAEEGKKDHARLVEVLAERDQSIAVLRGLAAAKEEALKAAKQASERRRGEQMETQQTGSSEEKVQERQGENKPNQTEHHAPPSKVTLSPNARSADAVSPSPKPALDYAPIPLERLRGLERARDATIAFLLRRIDQAESDMAKLNVLPVTSSTPG